MAKGKKKAAEKVGGCHWIRDARFAPCYLDSIWNHQWDESGFEQDESRFRAGIGLLRACIKLLILIPNGIPTDEVSMDDVPLCQPLGGRYSMRRSIAPTRTSLGSSRF
jgi:hypothetical protein